MTQHANLDCIIVGPSELDFRTVEKNLRSMGENSAAFRVLKANSVLYKGTRLTYMEMLNALLEETTGHPHHLYVCELPSLAVCHLKSYLNLHGLQTDFINFFPYEKKKLLDLLSQSPKAVAITTTFYVDNSPIIEIVDFVRQHSPQTKIIVGGPHIMNICAGYDEQAQDFIFQTIGADVYIHDSQGELTLSKLLHHLRNENQNLSKIPNLIYSNGDKKFNRTQRIVESNPIDKSIVDWQLFDSDYFLPTVQIRTARSCSFSCSFCQYPLLGGPVSLNDIDIVENQLRFLAESGVRNIVFIDDTFNVPLPRFKNICRMLIKNKFDFNWFSFFRCANADEEAFDLMWQSGCKGVFLGIESGDQTILDGMNKYAKVSKYEEGIRQLKERNIMTFVSLIVGFPGETQETVQNTIDFIESCAPTFYRAELYYHYTNVPIHQQAEKYGLQGSGYHWKHNTMDWQEACNKVDFMYKNIQESLVLPGYMFDFWAIPYLMGKGMSLEQITAFVSVAQKAMRQGL